MFQISTKHLILFFGLLIIAVNATPIMSRPPRNDVSNMADAIKYLQELDSYYSNVARPRHIRNDEDFIHDDDRYTHPELETAIQLLRLETIDRIYSKYTRPRFGKRANILQLFKDRLQDDNDLEDWQNKYLAQR